MNQAKTITLTFHITPTSKQSVRGGKKRFYTAPEKRQWVDNVNLLARAQYHGKPMEGPLCATIEWRFKAPRKRDIGTFKITRPDIDNLMKPLGDALAGVVFIDDSQLVDVHASKVWAAEPGITITVAGVE